MGLGVSIRVDGLPNATAGSAAFVEVTECVGEATQYRIEYSFDIADGDFPLLKDSNLGPGSDISVLVPTDETTACLVKGPVFGQQIQFKHGGSGSTLTVQGADSLIKLDREDKAVAWSNLTDSSAVLSILSDAGLIPDVETTQAGHMESKHTLVQRETDLSFIRRLARRNGFHFWVTCDAFGIETAHFKRPELDGRTECDLIINLDDPQFNVSDLDITFDVERATSTNSTEVDLNTKSDLSGSVQRSPLTALGGTDLSTIATGSRVAHVYAPVDDNGDLQARGEGTLIDAGFFLRASGKTTLSALKKVLRSHTLVNLRGVGTRHSGTWFCSAVRHSIDSAEHLMEFDLIRNGWAE